MESGQTGWRALHERPGQTCALRTSAATAAWHEAGHRQESQQQPVGQVPTLSASSANAMKWPSGQLLTFQWVLPTLWQGQGGRHPQQLSSSRRHMAGPEAGMKG